MNHTDTHRCVALFALSLLALAGCSQKDSAIPTASLVAEPVQYMGGSLHGIAANPTDGTLYIGRRGNSIIAMSPSGETRVFMSIPGADGTYSHGKRQTYLFDIHRLQDGSFMAAAKDTLFTLASNGAVTGLLEGLFDGLYGVCGVSSDARGNAYYAVNGRGIYALSPDRKESRLIEAVPGAVGVEVSPGGRFLYACDGDQGRLLVVDTLGKKKTREIKLPISPEYMHVEDDELYVKGPQSDSWIVFDIRKEGSPSARIRYDVSGIRRSSNGIETSVIVRNGGSRVLYGTCWDSGELYRVTLPDAR